MFPNIILRIINFVIEFLLSYYNVITLGSVRSPLELRRIGPVLLLELKNWKRKFSNVFSVWLMPGDMLGTSETRTHRFPRRSPVNLKIELPPKHPQNQETKKKDASPVDFAGVATEIIPNLFVGDVEVAQNGLLLKKLGITHILNCVAQTIQNYFPNEFVYSSIEVKDSPAEDIFCLFFDAIDFIETALQRGKVLIHCRCGISRSTAITMAYMMYHNTYSYQCAFEVVHRVRSACAPNAGFIMALRSWQSHLNDSPLKIPRLYRLEVHPQHTSQFLTTQVKSFLPHSGFCYVLHTKDSLYLWIGSDCSENQANTGYKFISQLQKYEKAPQSVVTTTQIQENDGFIETCREWFTPSVN